METDLEHAADRADLHWECRDFEALSPGSLYALLRLRSEIFVVEQACIFLDADGLDASAVHWLGWDDGTLAACQRCLPPGTPYVESSIGRIAVAESHRGRDLGRELVRRGIEFNFRQWPDSPIRLGAQSRLAHFYESLGFRIAGEPYMEDGIEHVYMLRDP